MVLDRKHFSFLMQVTSKIHINAAGQVAIQRAKFWIFWSFSIRDGEVLTFTCRF